MLSPRALCADGAASMDCSTCPGSAFTESTALGTTARESAYSASSSGTLVNNRSECLEALQLQANAAQSTGCFVFTHRRLDGIGAIRLAKYLGEECSAKFVDLSSLEGWSSMSSAAAEALQKGLRTTRALILDGNDMHCDAQALDAWCAAIRDHPGLQHLSLRDCALDDAAAATIAKALHRHSVLFSVDFGLNRIGDAGVSALTDAVGDSHVMLEVNVGGCDAGAEVCAGLVAVLERNVEKFRGRGSSARLLSELRRARANAQTAVAHLGASIPLAAAALGGPGLPGELTSAAFEVDAATIPPSRSLAAAAVERSTTFFAETPTYGQEDVDVGGPAVVFFDAPAKGDIFAELLARIDAGWRHTAADREILIDLRCRVDDLKSHRSQERVRAEEVLGRVAKLQHEWQERVQPMENRLLQLKAELANEVQATKQALRANLREKMTLEVESGELQGLQEDLGHCRLTAQKQESGLKLRHREVKDEMSAAEACLAAVESSMERTVADNERCRRLLHAARFETATERFVRPEVALAAAKYVSKCQEDVRQRWHRSVENTSPAGKQEQPATPDFVSLAGGPPALPPLPRMATGPSYPSAASPAASAIPSPSGGKRGSERLPFVVSTA